MALSSARRITVVDTGDFELAEVFSAADNDDAPGAIDMLTLASGANTVNVPGGGSTVTGATIIPPAGNTQSIVLKGVTGDTGIRLHDTDPTSIALDSSVTSFVLTAGGTVTGLRILWT
jgi:hypothetical protein